MSERKTILLRISPQMWEDISKWADDEFRSINGQIEYILKNALSKRNRLKPDDGSQQDKSQT
ncbi:MAG: Arc family DNA binding domain-containing protein [Eubacteriales bacterium]